MAAATPGGTLIRAERGSTGIADLAAELRHQMRSEYSEKVETVYADVFFYTLGLAILRLISSEGPIVFMGSQLQGLRFNAMRPFRHDMQIVFQDPYGSLSRSEALKARRAAGPRRRDRG